MRRRWAGRTSTCEGRSPPPPVCPSKIENSGRACALAQAWAVRESTGAMRDVVFVSVSDGVGVGVMIHGELLRGRNNVAGEFGHVPLSLDGPRCSCGSNGCWEAYISNRATLARYFGQPLSHDALASAEGPQFTIDDLIARARGRDAKAVGAIESTARYLGLGLAAVVNTFDPACVYIGGGITRAWDLIETTVRSAMAERALTASAAATDVRPVTATEFPRLRGAAALVVAPAYPCAEWHEGRNDDPSERQTDPARRSADGARAFWRGCHGAGATPRGARRSDGHDEARHHLHDGEAHVQGWLRLELPAGLVPAVGRDGSPRDDDLDPAAGHRHRGSFVSGRVPRNQRQLLLSSGRAGRRCAHLGPASSRRVELRRRLRRRAVAQGVVQTVRKTAHVRGVSALLGQRHVRRCRHRRSAKFLLRLYLEKRDPKYRPSLDKAIQFVLDSQYPIGAWPQRYPRVAEHSTRGLPDYTAYPTFNDDVAGENIDFLVMCYQTLGDARLLDPILRGMNAFIVTQQGPPQPGWSLQYTLDLKPVQARTYEPRSLATHTTARNLELMVQFYRLTGDTKFLARVPEAIDWLESIALPQGVAPAGRTHATFIEVGTNKPLYIHREGSNVVNGRYYWDSNPKDTLGHYSSFRPINIAALRKLYADARAMTPEQATKGSPLVAGHGVLPLPKFALMPAPGVSSGQFNRVAQQGGVLACTAGIQQPPLQGRRFDECGPGQLRNDTRRR